MDGQIVLRRRRTLTRRAALAAAGTGLALVGLSTRRLVAWEPGAARAAQGDALSEPPVRLAVDGLLETTLEAQSDPDATVGGMTYEGVLPGPVLRLRPGDRLRVNLINNLGGAITNLHVHGLHVSPQGNGDNVFVHVENGQTFAYDYLLPEDHQAGLYWYHPHHHGNTMQQTGAGLAGAIIVEGAFDDLPGIRDLPERLLCLQGPFVGPTGLQYLVNGQEHPTIALRPGETQRWRLLNASANAFFNLQVDGIELHQIALDGNPLPSIWTVDTLVLGPGERAEVLVQGGLAGEYRFRSLAWGERGQAQPEFLLATVVTAGDAVSPAALPASIMPLAPPLVDLSHARIDRRRVLTFTEATHVPYFGFDNRGFDPNRVDQIVRLGATEEWVVRNASDDWHPFHIHVNDFQVMTINGQPQAPHYKDTIPVPPNGSVVLRIRFLDFPGKFVYHCHILAHEDAGMMGVVEVVAEEPAATPVP
ncbi:MAG: multicopper oxidase family protein [Chloroflexota bacterium]|nr:multicopper oxidase family protein [Chloroflexota bacterium]